MVIYNMKIVVQKHASNFKLIINDKITLENISHDKVVDYINDAPGIDVYVIDKSQLIDRSKINSATFLN